ncbi:MAG: response regulator transcription factor [Candidatus Gastranaerophilaceae bacterium]
MTGCNSFGISKNKNLTQREMEVLIKIIEGKSNKEIAEELVITHHTVKSHITEIFRKLGVKNRTQAAVAAKSLSHSHMKAIPHQDSKQP